MFNIEDREKVRELFARYAAVDTTARHEEWLALFTQEAVVRSSIAPIEGREGLRNFTERLAQSAYQEAQMRHVHENLSMKLEADTGTAEATLTVWHTLDGKTSLFMVGTNTAKVRKIGNDWYIDELEQVVDTAIGQVNLEE